MADRVALITGIKGELARLVGAELARQGFRVIGVDYRPVHHPFGFEIEFYQANYNKTQIEDVFRRHRPTHVLHLGRVGNLKERMGKRFDLNVIGSRKVMDLSLKYEAQRMVVLSTFHIYGAHSNNHTPIYEDEPLRAGPDFPQIADAIQLDNQALMWTYRNPEVPTIMLRPCNVVGPSICNAMSQFLRQSIIPVMMGFNPMVQFIHEQDICEAILMANESKAVGVYNVAGQSPIPWAEALRLTRARLVPIPSSFATFYLKLAGMIATTFPPYLINFFKFPCVIADENFRETVGWTPKISEIETIQTTVGLGLA